MMAPRTGGRDAAERWFPVVGDDAVGPGLTVAPTQPRRGVVLVRVLGEIDMLTVQHLRDVVEGAIGAVADERDGELMAPGEVPSVICDLEGVTFLGASGLDVFAAVHETAVERGVHLVLVAAHRTVVRPLHLTALDRRLTVTPAHPEVGRVAAPGRFSR
ncbi:anti-anti-sigma factor [Actinomycetospora succinea]|uniref:Anti-anti-sigma factor n=1 Tax=Actinomycetospora succinea TaxID=663603 RepID=A0A4R6VMR0_9PSEU|nr:STAS domain-containing protein [Actinomycetospora succinea]TDQ63255.1 anti-anti-sigma factor [Actinomycetospora succinea]